MQMDNWYDLAIRELSDLTDPGTEKLAQAAEEALPEPAPEEEEEETPDPPAVPSRLS